VSLVWLVFGFCCVVGFFFCLLVCVLRVFVGFGVVLGGFGRCVVVGGGLGGCCGGCVGLFVVFSLLVCFGFYGCGGLVVFVVGSGVVLGSCVFV
ncbi:hypothetical protein RA262_28065, partial [Pseudomonas syringae pv. tagetis]